MVRDPIEELDATPKPLIVGWDTTSLVTPPPAPQGFLLVSLTHSDLHATQYV